MSIFFIIIYSVQSSFQFVCTLSDNDNYHNIDNIMTCMCVVITKVNQLTHNEFNMHEFVKLCEKKPFNGAHNSSNNNNHHNNGHRIFSMSALALMSVYLSHCDPNSNNLTFVILIWIEIDSRSVCKRYVMHIHTHPNKHWHAIVLF